MKNEIEIVNPLRKVLFANLDPGDAFIVYPDDSDIAIKIVPTGELENACWIHDGQTWKCIDTSYVYPLSMKITAKFKVEEET